MDCSKAVMLDKNSQPQVCVTVSSLLWTISCQVQQSCHQRASALHELKAVGRRLPANCSTQRSQLGSGWSSALSSAPTGILPGHMHTHAHKHAQGMHTMHPHACACAYTTHTCVHTCLPTCTHTYTHVYTCMHGHTHAHTFTCTHFSSFSLS